MKLVHVEKRWTRKACTMVCLTRKDRGEYSLIHGIIASESNMWDNKCYSWSTKPPSRYQTPSLLCWRVPSFGGKLVHQSPLPLIWRQLKVVLSAPYNREYICWNRLVRVVSCRFPWLSVWDNKWYSWSTTFSLSNPNPPLLESTLLWRKVRSQELYPPDMGAAPSGFRTLPIIGEYICWNWLVRVVSCRLPWLSM